MQTQALGIHQDTYDALFQHPISRNLQWRSVRAMLAALAEEAEEHNGNLKFTRNGHTLTVHPPRRKDFSDVQELMRIRHFLEQSGGPEAPAVQEGMHLLVVIDHREARIFKSELHGSLPQRITPHDPQGVRRHLRNVEEGADGQRKPEDKTFYDTIAAALAGAETILLLGSATGASSAMDGLMSALKQHHPDLAARVAGSAVVNEQHMSDDQLLAKARDFYAARGSPTK